MAGGAVDDGQIGVACQEIGLDHPPNEFVPPRRNPIAVPSHSGIDACREVPQVTDAVPGPGQGEAVVRHDVEQYRCHPAQRWRKPAGARLHPWQAIRERIDAPMQPNARAQFHGQGLGDVALDEVAENAAGQEAVTRMGKYAMGKEIQCATGRGMSSSRNRLR